MSEVSQKRHALASFHYVKVKIVSPVFYDPKGERQHV